MTSQKFIGSTLPLPCYPPATYLVNGVDCVPDVVQGLSGNARWVEEYVNGKITDVSPCAPLPPHSALPGHDHSGGIMGRPRQITLYSQSFGYPLELIGTSDFVLGRAPRNRVNSTVRTSSLWDNYLELLWIPGCAPDGCYNRLSAEIGVYATAAATLTLKWEVNGVPTVESETLTAGQVSPLVFDTEVRVGPGGLQLDMGTICRVGISVDYIAAQSDVSLVYLGLFQKFNTA